MVAVTLFGAATAHLVFFVMAHPTTQAPGPIVKTGQVANTTVVFNRPPSTPFTNEIPAAHNSRIINETVNATALTYHVRVPAQRQTGVYHARVSLYILPAVLPRGVLVTLARIQPVLASGMANGILTLSFYLIGRLVLGQDVPIRGSANRTLRRWFQ